MSAPITARIKAAIECAAMEPSPSEYRAQPTGLKIDGKDALFGVDGDGHLHLLLPVGAGAAVKEDKKSEGVRLVKHELMEGSARITFADLECSKPYLHATFHSLAQEVIETLEKDGGQPDEVALSVLAAWRELLDRPSSGPLGREQLAGLFAELGFLEAITEGSPAMLSAWTGPIPQRHDFSFESGAVEVKASLSTQRTVVRISGIDQLLPPEGGQLYLRHVKVEEAEGAPSVPDKIDAIVRGGVDRKELLARLGKMGYRLEHEEEYRKRCFREVEVRNYRVMEGFPRLIRSSFPSAELPNGIDDISYSVNLQMAKAYELESSEWSRVIAQFRKGITRA